MKVFCIGIRLSLDVFTLIYATQLSGCRLFHPSTSNVLPALLLLSVSLVVSESF